MRLSVLFAFIHFYSFCAGARYVLFKFRLQFVSIVFVSFCIFLSTITWPESVSVPCVSPSVYAEATMPTETYCQPAGGIVLCLSSVSLLTFSIFFSPLFRFYFGGGRSSPRPATRFTNKSRDRRNSNTTTTRATAAAAVTASTFLLALSSWAVVTMLEKFTEPVFISYSIISLGIHFHSV